MPERVLTPTAIVQAYDIHAELTTVHADWAAELTRIGRAHAAAHITDGIGDPTSLMEPGAAPITAYRVLPSLVAREAPWFIGYCKGPLVDLAGLALGATMEGAGDDTASLF